MSLLGNLIWFLFGGLWMGLGGGLGSFFLNLLWLAVSGLPLAFQAIATGCVFCVTIVGIPFGMQCFKLAKLSLMPFATSVVPARW